MAAGVVIALGAVIRAFGSNSANYSSSYRIGALAGTALVVVAAGWLFVWGIRRVRTSEHEPRAFGVSPPRRRSHIAMITVLVLFVGGGLVSAVWGSGSQASASSWNSQQGTDEHAGFINGCQGSGASTAHCECLFSRTYPQYNTPVGFLTLNVAAQRYRQAGNRADIPAAYVQSVDSCLASTP